MDFGGFICFGVGVLILMALGIGVLCEYDKRKHFRFVLLPIFIIWFVMMGFAAKFLYQEFYLNEGVVTAAMRGDAAQVKSFLAYGANPESRWEDGKTALQYAKESKNQESVDALIKAGAKK
jgi:hypothetical protein